MLRGARLLVDQLVENGAEFLFQVPGESFLAVLDALHDEPRPRLVTGRQEGGVAMMAEACGKLTGRPGIAFVTRGPGAANACAGVHVARQDETPLVLFVGDVARAHRHREAFQEVDIERWFQPLAKATFRVDDAVRLPEYVNRAFHAALSGRRGPVVVALPEEVLSEECEAPSLPATTIPQASPAPEFVAEVARRIRESRFPLLLVGGGDWSPQAAAALARFAGSWQLAVAAAFRCQDFLDNRHPSYVGDLSLGVDPALARAVEEADLLLVVGTRLDEISSGGFARIQAPLPRQRLIHVHPDPGVAGAVYHAELALVSASTPFLEALAALPAPRLRPWAEVTRRLRANWLRWNERPDPVPGRVDLAAVVRHLCAHLPEDAIVTNGAGNFSGWIHRYFVYRRYPGQLAPRSGSMGYGLPAAIAAALVHPDREVLCWTGDGDFQMTMQEWGTACQEGARILALIVDNGMYGTIRAHQERRYPDRPVGTALVNPDFAAFARSYGCTAFRVEETAAFADAFEAARRSPGPALIHLIADPEAITTRTSLSELRGGAPSARR